MGEWGWGGSHVPADLILVSPNPETPTFMYVVQRGKNTAKPVFWEVLGIVVI